MHATCQAVEEEVSVPQSILRDAVFDNRDCRISAVARIASNIHKYSIGAIRQGNSMSRVTENKNSE